MKLGRRQPKIDDMELRDNERRPNRETESQKFRANYPVNPIDDMELRENERRPNRETESQKFRSQYPTNPISNVSIPRPRLGQSTDRDVSSGRGTPDRRATGDYRRGYSDDDRMFAKSHSSRYSGEEVRRSNMRDEDRQERPRRPLSRSSDHSDYDKIGVSRMKFQNRGYDGD